MKIIDLRTGKTLHNGLTITEVGHKMADLILTECSNWSVENTEKVINKYKITGFHPFMFDVIGGK